MGRFIKVAVSAFVIFLTASVFAETVDVKLGGEIRVRGESVSNNTTGAKSQEQIIQRTRLNVDAKIDEKTKAYIQVQDSRAWGSDGTSDGGGTGQDNASTSTTISGTTAASTTTVNSESTDIKQAYVQFDSILDQPLSLKLGRQVMAYGDQRLIGGFEWSNTARSFDALKLMYNTDTFGMDLFYSKIKESVTNDTTDFKTNGSTDDKDITFIGIYAIIKAIENNTIDIYALQDKNDSTERSLLTYGARLNGKFADADYTAEYALQGGDNMKSGGTTISQESNALAVKAGYTLKDIMGLRIGAEYDTATGDNSSTSNKIESFQNLYPTNHPLYGFTDDIGWSNMSAMSLNAGLKPTETLWIGAEYWKYSLFEKDANSKDDLGSEINIMARQSLTSNVKCELSWVRRSAGEASGTSDYYGRTIDKDKTADFVYLQVNVAF